mmetsp:Transcript_25907/g.65671  ORF Transcript_25907/g.65671 Transcript_25907/m.65671 type:complete len:93 (+) Transcript_25907:2573-2851(+)
MPVYEESRRSNGQIAGKKERREGDERTRRRGFILVLVKSPRANVLVVPPASFPAVFPFFLVHPFICAAHLHVKNIEILIAMGDNIHIQRCIH